MADTIDAVPAAADGDLTPEELQALKDFNTNASGGTSNATTPDSVNGRQPMPGLEFLGRGYDVFGEYASAASCKQPVLDFAAEPFVEQQFIDRSISLAEMAQAFNQIPAELKVIYKLPKTVTFLPMFNVGSTQEFSSTLDEQTTAWSNHTNVSGGYGAFSGEVDARFKSKLAKLSTTKYSSLVAKSVYFHLGLSYSLGHPAPFRKEVQEDLDNEAVPAADFFEAYGTHYLAAILVGTRVTISCTLDTSRLNSKFGLDILLSASYGGKTGSISTENQTTFKKDVEKFREKSQVSVRGAGISDEQIAPIAAGAESGVAVLRGGWHNPTLTDFPQDALRPIWLRCTNESRKQALKAEFDRRTAVKKDAAALRALYAPMYLYRYFDGWWLICYRFHHSAEFASLPEASDVNWQIQNNGEPLFYVLSKQLPGSVPLFEYRHAGDNRLWRYETGSWSGYLDFMSSDKYNAGPYGQRQWHRVSTKPLGYVFDPQEDSLKTVTGATAAPLYSYCYMGSKEGPRFYYSLDPADHSRDDKEGWNRFVLLRDDMANMANRRYITEGHPEYTKPLVWNEAALPQWYGWTLEEQG